MSCRTEPSSRFLTKILIRVPTDETGFAGPENCSNTMLFPSGDQSGLPRYVPSRCFRKPEPFRLMLPMVHDATCNKSLVPSGDQTGRESPTDRVSPSENPTFT